MQTRSAWVHVKVTPSERTEWHEQAKAAGLTLADFMRERMGQVKPAGLNAVRQAKRRADPALLATLGRIGNNLSQVAIWCNSHCAKADALQVLVALVSIEQLLTVLLPKRRARGKGDGNAS